MKNYLTNSPKSKSFLKVNKNDTLTALTMYSIAAVVLVYLLLDLKIVNS